ncbi:YxlC family protein [Alicyclobacillus sp. ALC3]|uniref:YxlC family protein n=1 Tax=Alicyclobacillus sp. ALC3 TaxID=2796143 RepID=UPI002377E0EA|nr:YxlC family protein [Alicyclobacillus sp. ALC3]WDL98395.1 YxlC family protein [Alicyclobacillus sp. ALC3]
MKQRCPRKAENTTPHKGNPWRNLDNDHQRALEDRPPAAEMHDDNAGLMANRNDGAPSTSSDAFALQLVQSLDALQTLLPAKEPELEQFRQLVVDTQSHEQRRTRRDVLVFLGVALLVMMGWTFCMTYSPHVFVFLLIAVSTLSLLALPVGFVLQRFREETS